MAGGASGAHHRACVNTTVPHGGSMGIQRRSAPHRLLRLVVFTALPISTLALSATACTFMGIAARNVGAFFRTPDAVENPITDPIRPDAKLAVLWVGHSTVLIQIGDKFVLTDPVFTQYVGGLSRRLVEPGIAPEHLPGIDAVLVSHRHLDHLSRDTFHLLGPRLRSVLTPVGAAADIPKGSYRVEEIPYWRQWKRGGLVVTAVPVDHNGGRILDSDSHPQAFTGYVVQHDGVTVYFPGDTAYQKPMFDEVARRFGPIDLALMPIGPISPPEAMLKHHLNPEQALQAANDLQAAVMVPIHFGSFINSLDAAGDCEAALDELLRQGRTGRVSVEKLRIGEQRVIIAAAAAAYRQDGGTGPWSTSR
jgi:L-ascorbate metabolism protein UlaG (beta-lactamase superfamily)